MKKMKAMLLGLFILGSLSFANTKVESGKQVKNAKEIEKIILAKYPKANILKMDLDREHGRLIYETEYLLDNVEYEMDVDANTGEILKMETEHAKMKRLLSSPEKNMKMSPTQELKVSLEEAQKIALAQTKAGQLESIELKRKHGRAFYEVEVQEGEWEKQFMVDAHTAEVIQVKQERD